MNQKEKVKAAKAAYKNSQKNRDNYGWYKPNQNEAISKPKPKILIGEVDGESILSDDYPVHMDYFYVVVFHDNTHKVIMSDITADVTKLKNYIAKLMEAEITGVKNCNLAKRNLL